MDQIFEPNQALHDIDEAHCRNQTQSFCYYSLYYALGLITVYFSAAVNQVSLPHAIAVHQVDGKKVLKQDYRTVILDGHYRRCSVRLAKDHDHLIWSVEPFCMRYASLIDWKPITLAQAIKPITLAQAINMSKISNVSTAIVRHERSFTDIVQNVLYYTRSFERTTRWLSSTSEVGTL